MQTERPDPPIAFQPVKPLWQPKHRARRSRIAGMLRLRPIPVRHIWIAVAVLTAAVLARAKDVLARLEEGKAKTGGIAVGLDDLPLFAAMADIKEEKKDALRDALHAIDADALSPREALDAIYRLKQLAVDDVNP